MPGGLEEPPAHVIALKGVLNGARPAGFRPHVPGLEPFVLAEGESTEIPFDFDARIARFARRVYRSPVAQRAFLQRMRTSTEKLLLRPGIWVVVREFARRQQAA